MKSINILFMFAFIFLFSCADSTSAGAGGNTGNAIKAEVYLSNQKLENANIIIRQAEAIGDNAEIVFSRKTDEWGQSDLHLSPGQYLIEVNWSESEDDLSESLALFISLNVNESNNETLKVDLTGAKRSNLYGAIAKSIFDYSSDDSYLVCIKGTSYCSNIEADGHYGFINIPSGSLELVFVSNGQRLEKTQSVSVAKGQSVSLPIGWNLVFEDLFEIIALNKDYWKTVIGDGCPDLCGWGNLFFQSFDSTSNEINVESGNLNIVAHSYRNDVDSLLYKSARIESKNSWTYGRLEVRAKFSSVNAAWNIISLQSSDSTDLVWPDRGSIDLISLQGRSPDSARSIIHQKVDSVYQFELGTLILKDTSIYHDYIVEWNDQSIVFLIDGVEILKSSTSEVFKKPFYIRIEQGVGGAENSSPDLLVPFNSELKIEHIRLYQE